MASYLYTGGPEMLAPGFRAQRQAASIGALAGVPGLLTRRYGDFRQRESKEAATQAGLEARLGTAEDRVQDQAQPLDTQEGGLTPGMLGPTPPAAPVSSAEAVHGSSDQNRIQTVPADSGDSLGAQDSRRLGARRMADANTDASEGTLSRLARTIAAVGFGANIPQENRQRTIGILTGYQGQQQDRLKLLQELAPYMRYSADPGAVARSVLATGVVPSTGVRNPTAGLMGLPRGLGALGTFAFGAEGGGPEADLYRRAGQRTADWMRGLREPAPVETLTDQSTIDPTTGEPVSELNALGKPTIKRKDVQKGKPGTLRKPTGSPNVVNGVDLGP